MWNRESIKNYAKDFLRKHYWKAFLVCLIVAILTANGGGTGNRVKISDRYYENQMTIRPENKVAIEFENPISRFIIKGFNRSPVFFISWAALPIIIILFIALLITIGYALEVGKNRFFLRGFKDDVDLKNLFSTFNSMEYWGIIKTQFIRGLYNFLWSLLLIIPGIIKSYEYRMVPYILSEEPNLPSNEVIRRSREMTDGHKMDMFVLDLSFLGWYILGAIFYGIGGIFVNPYKEATMAKLYNILSGNDRIDDIEFIE